MAILGGSPLGLIGLKSMSDKTGMSTFNGGLSRNVKVSEYNRSRAGTLFSGQRRLRAWPNLKGKISPGMDISQVGKKIVEVPNKELDDFDTTGLADVRYEVDEKGNKVWKDGYQSPMGGAGAKGQNLLHNNDVYDTSVLNLIEKLAPTKGALKPADFAYLKDLGVYPNNRLMICRRFMTPTGDNIMVNNIRDGKARDVSSLGTMISWIPEGDNFLSITFGEVWEEAKADFTGILNSLGDDFGKSGLGDKAAAGGLALPLPGFTEIFQRMFLERFGLLDKGSGAGIPAGNPNLIKEAKVRTTVPYGAAGSGLATTVSIVMVCEYELKFISGIDPTIVWMDILGTITRFGTSNSSNYGLSGGVASRLAKWARNPSSLLTDVISAVVDIIKDVKDEVLKGLKKIRDAAISAAASAKKAADEKDSAAEEKEKKEKAGEEIVEEDPQVTTQKMANKAAKAVFDAGSVALNLLTDGIKKTITGSIYKYRVQVMGIVAALTGNPSTPWHLTIGNPLRPVFCSGDMLVKSTTLKLGPILAFNDLPSSITAEFTIENARPWGMQEIMAKFNSGYLRTVDIQKTYFETTQEITADKDGTERVTADEAAGILPPLTIEQTKDNTVNDDAKNKEIIGDDKTKDKTKAVDGGKEVKPDILPNPFVQDNGLNNSTLPVGTISAPKEPLKSVDTGNKVAPGSETTLANPWVKATPVSGTTLGNPFNTGNAITNSKLGG
jgi:hypothetical protein